MNQKLQSLIEAHSNKFTHSDHVIADAILQHPTKYFDISITQFAKELFVSKTSVTRFCVKIGLPGFKELKYILKFYNTTSPDNKMDEFTSMIDFFYDDYAKVIGKVKLTINEKSIKKTALNIASASSVYIVGVGSSGFLAQDFAIRIQRLGIDCSAITDNDFIKMRIEMARKSDFYIFISLTGKSKIVCNSLKRLKELGIKNTLLTEYVHSQATEYANLVILTPQKSNLALSEYISNQLGLILVTDIIFHSLFMIDPQKFKLIYDKTIINYDD